MNTDSLEASNETGLYLSKAQTMTQVELEELITVVSNLSHFR